MPPSRPRPTADDLRSETVGANTLKGTVNATTTATSKGKRAANNHGNHGTNGKPSAATNGTAVGSTATATDPEAPKVILHSRRYPPVFRPVASNRNVSTTMLLC